jgi:tetratricopeptide (TPR) repeat protein
MYIISRLLAGTLLLLAAASIASSAQTTDELDRQARQAYAAHDYKNAAELARRVYLAKAKSLPPDSFELATAALNLGKSLVLADQADEGSTFIGKACEIARKRFGNDDPRFGSCLVELAEAQLKARRYADAKTTADRALAVVKKAFPLDGYAAAAFHLGEVFHTQKTLTTSATFFTLATHLYGPSELNDTSYLDTSLKELGGVEYEEHSYKEAATHLQQAHDLDVQSSSDTSATGISTSYMLADSYSHVGDFDAALTLLKQVAATLESVSIAGHVSANDISFRIAELQEANGGTSDAIATYSQILKRSKDDDGGNSLSDRVRALYLSAEDHDKQHDTAQTERYFGDAIQLASANVKKEQGGALLVEALQEFSQYLLRHGRSAEARLRLDEALKIVGNSDGPDSVVAAGLLQRIAAGLINVNDCESALPLIQRATDIYAKKDSKRLSYIQSLKMSAFCTTDSTQRAALTRHALDLQLQVTHEIDAGLAREEAQEYYRLGQLSKAEKAALLALNLDANDIEAHDVLADVYADQNRLKEAVAMEQKAIAMSSARYGEDALVVAGRNFNLGKLLLRGDDRGDAFLSFEAAAKSFDEHVEQSLALLSLGEQRQLLIGQATAQTSGLLSVCQETSCLDLAYGWLLPWKGQLVEGLRRETQLTRAAITSANSDASLKWRTARSQLAEWSVSRGTIPYDEWRATNDRLLRNKEAYERQLVSQMRNEPTETRISIGSFQKVLRPNEAFVDIYRFSQFGKGKDSQEMYGAILTTADSGPKFVKIGTANTVDAAMNRWRGKLDGPFENEWAALMTVVWEPIHQALPAGTTVVRVSPDGALGRLPWHFAMHGLAASSTLEITEIESGRALMYVRSTGRRHVTASNLLLVGDLDYDAGRGPTTPGKPGSPFKHLEWAAQESISIAGIAKQNGVEVTWRQQAAASKKTVLEDMQGRQYLHFATHGFTANKEIEVMLGRSWSLNSTDRPSRDPLVDSGLALSGANVTDPLTHQTSGILTAEELLDGDLSASDLVVLSACSTGLGTDTPGQGLEGLRSAFLASGARTLVMSLWNVDDEATALLMKYFYEALFHDSTVVAALHMAQEQVRSDTRFASPRFWAGWIIVGAD